MENVGENYFANYFAELLTEEEANLKSVSSEVTEYLQFSIFQKKFAVPLHTISEIIAYPSKVTQHREFNKNIIGNLGIASLKNSRVIIISLYQLLRDSIFLKMPECRENKYKFLLLPQKSPFAFAFDQAMLRISIKKSAIIRFKQNVLPGVVGYDSERATTLLEFASLSNFLLNNKERS